VAAGAVARAPATVYCADATIGAVQRIREIVDEQREWPVVQMGVWLPIDQERLVGSRRLTRLEGVAHLVDLTCKLGHEGNEMVYERRRMYVRKDWGQWMHVTASDEELIAGHPLWLLGAVVLQWSVVEEGCERAPETGFMVYKVSVEPPVKGTAQGSVMGRFWIDERHRVRRIAYARCHDLEVVDLWNHRANATHSDGCERRP
jgi:hypothetical protein